MITKKSVYCVYKFEDTDAKLVGIFTNENRAVSAIRFIATGIKEPLTTDDYYNIESINRTKSRKINFIIEQTTLNKILYNNL